jgi:predicted AlkP superfamily pyrophosphatase or phosphodiesterase
MPRAKRVILFLIDGLRPDALSEAHTPTIDGLVLRGTHTWEAQTVTPSITLPCHASLFQSVPPDRHGILENDWTPREPRVPDMMEVVHRAELGTAAFYTWEPLRDLTNPGTLDMAFFHRLGDLDAHSDLVTHAVAASCLVRERPALTFIYWGAVDEVGHRHGWMSEPYLRAVSMADRGIGRVLDALSGAGLLEDTISVVLGDHGGHDTDHKFGLADDLTIPWVVSGPGIRQGHEISAPVSIMDTAPTIAGLLGIAAPAEWRGHVIREALST